MLCEKKALFDKELKIPPEMDMISPQAASEVIVKLPFFTFHKHGVRHEAHRSHLANLSDLIPFASPGMFRYPASLRVPIGELHGDAV